MKTTLLRDELKELLSARPDLSTSFRSKSDWSRDELIGLCRELHLRPECALLLALKNEWERHCADAGLDDPPEGDVTAKSDFKPDATRLFGAFRKEGLAGGVTEEAFDKLVREMVLEQLHLASVDSPEFEAFLDRREATAGLLSEATPEQQARHATAYGAWVLASEELEDLCLAIERQRVGGARTTQEFMSRMGEVFLRLQREANRVMSLERRLELKEADPTLTPEALDRLVADQESQAAAALERLRLMKEFRIPAVPLPVDGVPAISFEEAADYERKVKGVLRKLRLLLHPDRLTSHPSFEKLTARQKEILKSLWNMASTIRPEDLAYAPGQIGYAARTYQVLHAALQRALVILETAGIDTDACLIPQGDTIEERIAWYERELERLELDIVGARAELKQLLDDPVVEERRAILTMSPKQQEKIIDRMRTKTREYHQQAEALEARLEELFKGELRS